MAIRDVHSADGTSIVYRVTGPAAGRPLIMLHGWSANLQCWGAAADELAEQFRVIAVDLRGHGYSGVPATGYDDPKNWAADIAAVLAGEGIETGAVLLGWSYGGIALTDYLAAYGTGAIDGVFYTASQANIGRKVPGAATGPAMQAAMPDVFEESAGRAVRAFGGFGNANTGSGADKGADAQRLFGASLATPPAVRKALFYRTVDNTETLRTLDIPVMVQHGTDDPVVPIENGQYILDTVPDAGSAIWEGAKHGLFIQDRPRFVAEVTEFISGL